MCGGKTGSEAVTNKERSLLRCCLLLMVSAKASLIVYTDTVFYVSYHVPSINQ